MSIETMLKIMCVLQAVTLALVAGAYVRYVQLIRAVWEVLSDDVDEDK